MAAFQDPSKVEDELTRLLLKAVPENAHGRKTLNHLASLVPVSKWAMRLWIVNQRIPPERVVRIVEIGRMGVKPGSPGRVSENDFDPFVYKE